MKTHTCPVCGHEIRFNGELDGRIEHRPDGGHKWSTVVHVGLTLEGFKHDD